MVLPQKGGMMMKFLRKICSLCLVLLLLLTMATSVLASDGVTVKIDGEIISFDVPPQIINDRTMVPLRAIFEALGATVVWDGNTQTVTSVKDDTTIRLTINAQVMYVNGEEVLLDSPACLVNDRTLVPIRAVSEAFQNKVNWIAEERTVEIRTLCYSMEGVSVEEVLRYFQEVCLDSEYIIEADSDPTVIQKWEEPIYYYVGGTPTEKDLSVIEEMAEQLNSIEGFPGFYPAEHNNYTVGIYFCSSGELIERLGSNFNKNHYGGFVFWYMDNAIYEGTICCRRDISQKERTSVILEEIYGLLGPAQDTVLRKDSILYQYSDSNLELSDMDVLILQLLYHPDIRCGMNYKECEQIIREIYY